MRKHKVSVPDDTMDEVLKGARKHFTVAGYRLGDPVLQTMGLSEVELLDGDSVFLLNGNRVAHVRVQCVDEIVDGSETRAYSATIAVLGSWKAHYIEGDESDGQGT